MTFKVKRLSSMVTGYYCALEIDGQTVNRLVKENDKGRYIIHKHYKIYQNQTPLGEEVTIK